MHRRPGLKWLLYAACIWTVALCCGCSLNAQFVDAVDRTWATIGPEYQAYVDADATLDDNTKETRKRTAETLTLLIEEAKK